MMLGLKLLLVTLKALLPVLSLQHFAVSFSFQMPMTTGKLETGQERSTEDGDILARTRPSMDPCIMTQAW